MTDSSSPEPALPEFAITAPDAAAADAPGRANPS